MKPPQASAVAHQPDPEERSSPVGYDFGLDRRSFVHVIGSGLLLAVASPALGQRAADRGGGGNAIGARIHLAEDGAITVFTGKIEMGQGARAQLTQVAAEELRVSPERLRLVMGDTDLVPDDGLSAGSRTTPSTVPAVRAGAAAARGLLESFAAAQWKLEGTALDVQNGGIRHPTEGKSLSYADLARSADAKERLGASIPPNIRLVEVRDWKVMGRHVRRPNRRDIVTGAHVFPSDVRRPGMLYGKVLRAPAIGSTLVSVDVSAASAWPSVKVLHDGSFVGVAARTTHEARAALEAIARTATWSASAVPASAEVHAHLRSHARDVPSNPFGEQLAQAHHKAAQTYQVAYVQHAPMEPRVAVAEWQDGKLTVWTGTQNPFGYRRELMGAFHLAEDKVRVIVPDFGGGFGGKHTAEAAIEAARLARAAGGPVSLRWTREEEFTWAYFRPAGAIDIEATLDAQGAITSWHCVNIGSGPSSIDTPYKAGKSRSQFVNSNSPLRTGSYRALAANANTFARECFMDELAEAAHQDPLAFRLAHLENPRLRAVLETVAARFGWSERVRQKQPQRGVGIACGTEKGSVVATCAEIELDPALARIRVLRICEAFECGPVIDRDNLIAQIQGCIIMALGPALREAMRFEQGRILNASFRKYQVPRLDDIPELDLHIVERPDAAPAGAGETPMIAVAPAIANAVFHATGRRVRDLPIRPPGAV